MTLMTDLILIATPGAIVNPCAVHLFASSSCLCHSVCSVSKSSKPCAISTTREFKSVVIRCVVNNRLFDSAVVSDGGVAMLL